MDKVIYIDDFDYSIVGEIPKLYKGKGRRSCRQKGIFYIDAVCAFDIETTWIKVIDQAVLYIWQFQLDNICTVYGRDWDSFRRFFSGISKAAKGRIMVYVHNLSYEWQFIKTALPEIDPTEVFAIDTRKVLRFTWRNIEFRCSYLLSNMSLAKFTETMKVEDRKLSGFDYKKQRFPWTDLSADELAYCLHDVQGLVQAVKMQMALDGDDLYHIPFTSTGYVRRDVKTSVKNNLPFNWLADKLPDLYLYRMLSEAFRGGNTHANRYYTGQILENVHSWDRSSSYPDVQCNCKFPIGRWNRCGNTSTNFERFNDLIFKRKRAVLARVRLVGVRLKDPFYGCPYLSISKCRQLVNYVNDNGRVLSADHLETTITDVDWLIISDVYSFDECEVSEIFYCRYGYLPKAITDCTIDYYVKKTSLKGTDDEYLYMKSKNKLNSIYGMSAQRPVRTPLVYDPEDRMLKDDPEADLVAELAKSNKKAFQSYAWGVWVTAWARFRLHEGIRLVGDGFVYCDTDSVKYIGEVNWKRYNKQRIDDSLYSGAYADDVKGKRHYMGVYEHDGDYKLFKTLGAKKYCYVDDAGLHLTVAGVNKKLGAEELAEHGGIEAFKEGFVFRKAGGTESLYNDMPQISFYHIQGHDVEITSNVVIKDSTYTLDTTGEYRQILKDAYLYRQSVIDLFDGLNYNKKERG